MTNPKETAPAENPSSTPVLGPWTQTTTTKFSANALEVIMTRTVECSHVPPEESPCSKTNSGGNNTSVLAFLQQATQIIGVKLDEIRSAQNESAGESDGF